MIEGYELRILLANYDINYKKLIENNDNILKNGDIQNIRYVLKYLIDEKGISGKNIEKCPSILYRNVQNIKQNYEFLQQQNITFSNVEGCLHVLSSEPNELKAVYNYVKENYGDVYLNKITSILRASISRIMNVENIFLDNSINDKSTCLAACISRFDELELREIIKVCKANGIEITRSVFQKRADEIEKIVGVCKANGIEITESVFLQRADEIEKIVGVCKANGIEITGSVFRQRADELEKSINFIKSKYSDKFLISLIIIIKSEHLEKIFRLLEEKGLLEVVVNSASILKLKYNEITSRIAFLEDIGLPVVENGKFNSIFGMNSTKMKKRFNITQEDLNSKYLFEESKSK